MKITKSIIIITILLLIQSTAIAQIDITVSDKYDFIQTGYAVADIKVRVTPYHKEADNIDVEFRIVTAENNSDAVYKNWHNKMTGLSWDKAQATQEEEIKSYKTTINKDGFAEAHLVDIMGERTITVEVHLFSYSAVSQVFTVEFGKGPLSVFQPIHNIKSEWKQAYQICNGIEFAGSPEGWSIGYKHLGGKMPTAEALQAVSMPGIFNTAHNAYGAAKAAGWPLGRYWTGRALMKNKASRVNIKNGNVHGTGGGYVQFPEYVACMK